MIFDEDSERERAKYVLAYSRPKYRRNAGRQSFKNMDRITSEVLATGAHDVWDFGCGDGSSSTYLEPLGVYTFLTDFMGPEYINPAVVRLIREGRAQFFHNSLWDPALPAAKGQYGICTDVMEHIPHQHVETVLRHIRERVPVCFFRIAMSEDSQRKIERHGGKLHVTVRPTHWWMEQLLLHFGTLDGTNVETNATSGKQVLVVTAYK